MGGYFIQLPSFASVIDMFIGSDERALIDPNESAGFTPSEDEQRGEPLVHAEPGLAAAVLQSLLGTGDGAVASRHASVQLTARSMRAASEWIGM